MDEQRGTQKEIAKRYEDKVGYRNTKTPWRRTRFWLSFIALVGGAAAIYFWQDKAPPEFFNTGPLSRPHSALSKNFPQLQNDCVACHEPESISGGSVAPGRLTQVLDDRFHQGAPAFARIDQKCEACHQQHAFHEPNVVENRSCSACHKEHQGSGPMHAVVSLDCASCHNDRGIMQASSQRGKQLPPTQFRLNPKVVNATTAQAVLQLPRPPDGYTTAFESFWNGHPSFQVQRDNVRELDVLRFNHQRHLDGRAIPLTKAGGKLDCNYCHKPEPNGRYMQRVSFAANCQECHSLQFDVKNPDFQLPHGDAQLVRTFLRTLPAQYGELARRKRGQTNDARIGEFAAQQIRQLLTQFPSAEELERTVFFTKDPYKASQQSDPATRAKYTGCAFCHEAKQAAGVSYPTAEITRPATIDRWMPHAQFNHAKHQTVSACIECHTAAASSRLTSDMLMPTKESCARCHSATGQAMKASECTTCHTYHAPEPAVASPLTASNRLFKQMLLGRR